MWPLTVATDISRHAVIVQGMVGLPGGKGDLGPIGDPGAMVSCYVHMYILERREKGSSCMCMHRAADSGMSDM